jgi:peptidoglycan/LPS O-acetylase OafA/YrhL
LQTLLLLPSFEVRPTFEIYLAEHLFPANPPSWSLFFELWVGLAFWAWARQARPFQGAAFFMLLFGTLYVIALFLHGPVLGWSKNTLAWGFARVGVFFFVGVIFWLYRDKLPKVDWKTYLVILSTYVFLFSIRSRAAGFLLLATSPILVMLTIGLPRPDLPWVRLLLTYLGRISFPIYIVHYPLLEIAKYLLGETHIRSAFGVGSYFLAAIFFSEILIRLDSRLSPMRVAFSKARIIK